MGEGIARRIDELLGTGDGTEVRSLIYIYYLVLLYLKGNNDRAQLIQRRVWRFPTPTLKRKLREIVLSLSSKKCKG